MFHRPIVITTQPRQSLLIFLRDWINNFTQLAIKSDMTLCPPNYITLFIHIIWVRITCIFAWMCMCKWTFCADLCSWQSIMKTFYIIFLHNFNDNKVNATGIWSFNLFIPRRVPYPLGHRSHMFLTGVCFYAN